MKKIHRSSCLIALATLSLFACGKDSDKKKDGPREAPKLATVISGVALTSSSDDKALLGDWSGVCRPFEDNDGSAQAQFIFKENHALMVMTAYFNTNCTSPAFTSTTVMNYRASSKVVTTLAERFTVRLHHAAVAQVAGEENACGYNVWNAGVDYDLTNATCDGDIAFGDTKSGTQMRGAYTVNGNQLNLDSLVLTRTGTTAKAEAVDFQNAAEPARLLRSFRLYSLSR